MINGCTFSHSESPSIDGAVCRRRMLTLSPLTVSRVDSRKTCTPDGLFFKLIVYKTYTCYRLQERSLKKRCINMKRLCQVQLHQVNIRNTMDCKSVLQITFSMVKFDFRFQICPSLICRRGKINYKVRSLFRLLTGSSICLV